MSRYTDYQKKIAPWAKAWHFIHRHKVLILSACAALFVAVGTLIGIKGAVIDDGVSSDVNLVYGEAFEFKGSAIFGDVVYEYRAIDSDEWTEVQPTDVGTYEVRACSTNSFGGHYHSGYKKITIAPKESTVSFSGNYFVYGDKPRISVDLVPGDEVSDFGYRTKFA